MFVVFPGALLGWEVLREGEEEGDVFDDRYTAIEHARHLAENHRPALVKIENWFGRIECEWVFDKPEEWLD